MFAKYFEYYAIIRAGFSLSRALFRKKCGALPNIRIPPD